MNFFYNIESVMHDMKAPLAIMFSSIQTLELLETCEEAEKVILLMKRNCVKMMRMIQALHSSQKLIEGMSQSSLYDYNMVMLTEDAVMNTALLADKKNVELLFDTDCEELVCAVDRLLYERIMHNILLNAIKYSPCGGTIRVCFYDLGEYFRVEVSDMGAGIAEDVAPHIFDKYVTAEKNEDAFNEGIGLAIVRDAIAAMGGKTYVKESGGFVLGTTMAFELPIRTVDRAGETKFEDYETFYQNMIQIKLDEDEG
ncbi:hypothetical protein FACS189490_00300 [Clostridia bacterium]|nr:hypothetical protein FACS189490_00300 [Clostridia bacterium]